MFMNLVLGFFSVAMANQVEIPTQLLANQAIQMHAIEIENIDWKVGDSNEYNLKMGFLGGTMTMSVTESIEQGYWLRQVVDLRIQKQTADVLIDRNDGSVKRIVVDGKDQDIPKKNFEIIEMKEDRVTVPAGTYDAIYVRIKDTDSNEESEQWVNPDRVAISGMLKSLANSQIGQVVIELTSTTRR